MACLVSPLFDVHRGHLDLAHCGPVEVCGEFIGLWVNGGFEMTLTLAPGRYSGWWSPPMSRKDPSWLGG